MRNEDFGMRDMMGVVQGLLTPLIRQWLRMYEQIDPHVLTVHLGSAVLDFGTELLGRDVVIPTWADIQKANRSLNWMEIL